MSAQMKRFIAALAMVGTLFAVLLGIHVVQGVNKGASTVSSSANEVAEEQKEDHAQNQEPPLSTKWMLLTEKGWTAIESPSKETMGSAWVKQGGQWQWAFVSAQQSGKTTCITVLFWRY